jgi:hypothetical protein
MNETPPAATEPVVIGSSSSAWADLAHASFAEIFDRLDAIEQQLVSPPDDDHKARTPAAVQTPGVLITLQPQEGMTNAHSRP